jgi:hypothetical protein
MEIPRLIDARHAGCYRVWLRFSDGLSGEIDLQDMLWGPMFEPLRDMAVFSHLGVDPELETLAWENGADIAPESLYERLRQSRLAAAE